MLFKVIVVGLLLFVVGSLFTAFYYLVRDPSTSRRVVRALFFRVGLSLFIVLLLMVGAKLGWVTPHGFGE